MAAANWTGLFNLCLKQRERDQNSDGVQFRFVF